MPLSPSLFITSLYFPIPENEVFSFLSIYDITPLYCSYKSDNHQLFKGYKMQVNYMPPCAMTAAVTKIPAHGAGFIKSLLQEQRNKKRISWGLATHPRPVGLLKSSDSSVAITCINRMHCSFTHLILLLDPGVLCYSFNILFFFMV